jgi:hypothetical protein
MADPIDDIARTLKSLRETSKTDSDRTISALREAAQRDSAVRGMVAQIGTALADVVQLLERMADDKGDDKMNGLVAALRDGLAAIKQEAPVVNVAAPVVNVAPAVVEVKPVIASDWTSLRVEMPVNSLGRPTGSMTITKVR